MNLGTIHVVQGIQHGLKSQSRLYSIVEQLQQLAYQSFAKLIKKLLILLTWFNLLPFLVIRFIQKSF